MKYIEEILGKTEDWLVQLFLFKIFWMASESALSVYLWFESNANSVTSGLHLFSWWEKIRDSMDLSIGIL